MRSYSEKMSILSFSSIFHMSTELLPESAIIIMIFKWDLLISSFASDLLACIEAVTFPKTVRVSIYTLLYYCCFRNSYFTQKKNHQYLFKMSQTLSVTSPSRWALISLHMVLEGFYQAEYLVFLSVSGRTQSFLSLETQLLILKINLLSILYPLHDQGIFVCMPF